MCFHVLHGFLHPVSSWLKNSWALRTITLGQTDGTSVTALLWGRILYWFITSKTFPYMVIYDPLYRTDLNPRCPSFIELAEIIYADCFVNHVWDLEKRTHFLNKVFNIFRTKLMFAITQSLWRFFNAWSP